MRSSDGCKANFGRSAKESFTYHDLLAGIHPDDLDAMQMAVRDAIEHHEIYRAEYRILPIVRAADVPWPATSPMTSSRLPPGRTKFCVELYP